MNENDHQQPEGDLDAPPKLAAALKYVSRSAVFVPPYIDNAILKAASQHLGRGFKARRFRLWMLWPAAIASCAVIVCVIRFSTTSDQSRCAREDINHDGKVDILDSFALARQLKSAKELPGYNTNDVVLIATHAVQLNKDNGS